MRHPRHPVSNSTFTHVAPPRRVPFALGALACLAAAATPNDAIVELTGGGPTPSFIIGIAFAAASLFYFRLIPPVLVRSSALVLFACAFAVPLLVLLISIATGDAVYSDQYSASKPLKLIVMALLLSVAASDQAWRKRILPAYLWGWWAFVFLSIAQVAAGRHSVSTHKQAQRVSILGMNENQQAIIAATGIILLLAAALRTGRVRSFVLLLTGALLGGFVFVLGNSRGGLLALAVGILIVVFAEVRARWATRSPIAPLVLSLAISCVAVAALGLWSMERFDEVESATAAIHQRVMAAIEGSDRGARDTLALRTVQIIRDNPLGIGYGRTIDELWVFPHNDFLKLTAEGGWPAAAFLIAAFAAVALTGLRASRYPGEAGALGALAVTTIAAVTGQGLTKTAFWLFLSVVLSFNLTNRRGQRP